VHLSTFTPRQVDAGWVVDATAVDGTVKQLVGVYLQKKDAENWITEHTPEWFRLRA
jgi:hypothetical protein